MNNNNKKNYINRINNNTNKINNNKIIINKPNNNNNNNDNDNYIDNQNLNQKNQNKIQIQKDNKTQYKSNSTNLSTEENEDNEVSEYNNNNNNLNTNNIILKEKDIEKIIEKEKEIEIKKEIKKEKLNEKNIEKEIENENNRLFTLCIDGSLHTEKAYNLIIENFLFLRKNKEDHLLLIYIYDTQKDNNYNYRNKKETIISKYSDMLNYLDEKKYTFRLEDKHKYIEKEREKEKEREREKEKDKEKEINPNNTCNNYYSNNNKINNLNNINNHHHLHLEQVNKISNLYKSDFLFCGFNGLKGPLGDNNLLTKGIEYLIKESFSPFFLIKDLPLRENKLNKSFNWLFIFDKNNYKSISILDKVLPLIDSERDFVYGINFIDENNQMENYNFNFEEIFCAKIKSFDVRNSKFHYINYNKSYSSIILMKINFGDIDYDFVVLFNSKKKHIYETEVKCECENFSIINSAKANICVING
jgi:hypothetical protein